MFKFTLALVAVIALTGCASIVSDSTWPVTVNSSPSGAMVTVKDQYGVTVQRSTAPTTIMLPSGKGFFTSATYTFTFEKEGYEPTIVTRSAKFNGWYIGNLVFGGPIGFLIVDPITGAMWRFNSSEIVEGDLSTAVATGQEAKAQSQAGNDRAHAPKQGDQDIAEKLKKLKELKDSGLITDSEYQAKRKALVDKLGN